MPPYHQIILFGDSITEWSTGHTPGFAFHPALQNMYTRRFDIINRGFAGYNTDQARRVLPNFMPTPEQATVRLIAIFFGANDSCLPHYPSHQHVPLDKYKENLKTIISHATVTAHQDVKILLIVPPPIDERMLKDNGFADGREAPVTAKYAQAAREVAGEFVAANKAKYEAKLGNGRYEPLRTDVASVDLWTEFMKRAVGGNEDDIPKDLLPGDKNAPVYPALQELFVDGLHFTPLAYELMFETVLKTIKEKFPELHPEKIEWEHPHWADAPKL